VGVVFFAPPHKQNKTNKSNQNQNSDDLFARINALPTCYEVVSGKAKSAAAAAAQGPQQQQQQQQGRQQQQQLPCAFDWTQAMQSSTSVACACVIVLEGCLPFAAVAAPDQQQQQHHQPQQPKHSLLGKMRQLVGGSQEGTFVCLRSCSVFCQIRLHA
jgi:hypothetical protein